MTEVPQMTFSVIARRSIPLPFLGVLLSLAGSPALADARCARLVALNDQYRDVALTSEQKDLKRKLLAWYNANCGHTRQASAR